MKPAPPPAVQQAKASVPEKPVISLFAASPGTIDKGGQTTLRSAVEHANNVQTLQRWARHGSPEAGESQATKNQIQELLNRIQDAYFDYNRHNLRPDAQQALVADAKPWARS
jgi:outer membrane protein OmpA-like peptidoglycan-associated protein